MKLNFLIFIDITMILFLIYAFMMFDFSHRINHY